MSKFRAGFIFSDRCVLQQGKPVCVFGYGEDGKTVTVTLGGDTESTYVKGDKWKVYLPARKAETNLSMQICCDDDTINFSDIAIGEVWLAGGQSNMEFELQNAVGGKEMLQNDNPDVRFYYTPKIEWEDEENMKKFENSAWTKFSSENARNWSAVGYIFGKHLSEVLGVTVGIIGCNWGGSSASCWIPEEDIMSGWESTKSYITDFEKGIEGISLEEQKKAYIDYMAFRDDWDPKCAKLYEENPNIEWDEVERILGPAQYPGPMNRFNPMRPCGLYHIMIKRVIEYTMAGVIYYQGESDDHKPDGYYDLFSRLIARWRLDNGDPNLPFIAVQLPMHRYKQDPDYRHWPIIRMFQRRVIKSTKNCGLAIAIDQGTFNDIHPKDKREVGKRLALQALWLSYGKISETEASAPRLDYIEYTENCAYVSLAHVGAGLEVRGDEITGFEISPSIRNAGEEDFVPAKAKIMPDGRIKVYSDKFETPKQVRYLWYNWAQVSLFRKDGLPVEPFRG